MRTAPPAGGEGAVATAVPAVPSARPAARTGEDAGAMLGGYRILNKLGQGGMGAVYRAIQLSLNRDVALKVLLDRLSADPHLVARFTREAYAAAQISHHHMVQIHDIGAQQRRYFFSMEFVDGKTLAQLVAEQGRLEPETAAGYVLQAARGLKFAHDHGMVHRDVKPENLLLSGIGMVKVADLGLVKTLEPERMSGAEAAKRARETGNWYAEETQLNVSMGTPAYMAPEQAQDAANVDARADIYALGCTLYTLLVGHPPFKGSDSHEVIHRHIHEPPVPPDELCDDVLPSLAQIVMRMMAKRPEDRYQEMGEVIEALEQFLGLPGEAGFEPKPEQIKTLENSVTWFNGVSWARVRSNAITGYFVLCALLLAVALLLPVGAEMKGMLAGAVAGVALLTPVMYIILTGLTRQTYLFMKVRELIWEGGVREWLMIVSAAGLGVAVLVVLGWHWAWLVAAGIAFAAAAGFHYGIDVRLEEQRRQPLGHLLALLKMLRGQGMPEPALRKFVCRRAGERWEEIFEAAFGYEAKMQARRRWGRTGDGGGGGAGNGDPGRPRPRWAAWRDPIIHWVEQVLRERRMSRERRLIQTVEEQSLRASGLLETMARRRAQLIAEQIVARGSRIREQTVQQSMELTAPRRPSDGEAETSREGSEATDRSSSGGSATIRKPLNYTDGLEGWEHQSYFRRRYGSIWNLVFGPPVRFIAGCALLFVCVLWLRNVPVGTEAIVGTVDAALPAEVHWLSHPPGVNVWEVLMTVCATGLLLMASAFINRPMLSLWLLLATLAMLAGGPLLPPMTGISPYIVSLGGGLVLAAMGFLFTRSE
jgi:eukaryotic-like serine/threonine-protein kinase